MLRDCDIAKINSHELQISDLIEHCRNRKGTGTKPATIYHDMAYLRSVMKKSKLVFNIESNFIIFDEALPILLDINLIGKSKKKNKKAN